MCGPGRCPQSVIWTPATTRGALHHCGLPWIFPPLPPKLGTDKFKPFPLSLGFPTRPRSNWLPPPPSQMVRETAQGMNCSSPSFQRVCLVMARAPRGQGLHVHFCKLEGYRGRSSLSPSQGLRTPPGGCCPHRALRTSAWNMASKPPSFWSFNRPPHCWNLPSELPASSKC